MGEKFFKMEYVQPEYRKLHELKSMNLAQVIEYFEGGEEDIDQYNSQYRKESKAYDSIQENQFKAEKELSIFDGFLYKLREKGVRVSTPEWLQFLRVVEKISSLDQLKELVSSSELLYKIRLYAMTTLVKDKTQESAFHIAFDEYFGNAAQIFNKEIEDEEVDQESLLEKENSSDTKDSLVDNNVEEDGNVDSETPEIKESLGIKEVDENLQIDDKKDHDDNENVHGGKKDQHNDILKKQDKNKIGGGDKKDNPMGGSGDKGKEGDGKGDKGKAGHGKGKEGEDGSGEGDKGDAGKGKGNKGENSGLGFGEFDEKQDSGTLVPPNKKQAHNLNQPYSEDGYLIGGGKGNSSNVQLMNESHNRDDFRMNERKLHTERFNPQHKYEKRPDKQDIKEVIRSIRKIITDVSEIKSRDVNLRSTVGNFARNSFRFEFNREREKQPEIVLFIDVGGPVDEWSPLIKQVSEEMTKGLSKLEVYLFHNNLYGYVWKPDEKNFLASSYAKPNSLLDVKHIVKKRKKVIIYGDAEMSSYEFQGDGWPPRDNEDRVQKYSMSGPDCLHYIKRNSDNCVWINPVFKKEWQNRDNSGTITAAQKEIPMYDLTVGGVEDAIKGLMKR